MKQIKVIGIGGIGTWLLSFLCFHFNFGKDGARLTLVDGDDFETKNSDRQLFEGYGNKAKNKAGELAKRFKNISFRSVHEFVNGKNIKRIIQEDEIVFLCVDNHKTRKLVSDHCKTLDNVTLISGGNELTDGNVQVFIRKDKKDFTAPLDKFHPEIRDPKDKSPDDLGCQERMLQTGSPQLFITNSGIAWLMYANLWKIENNDMNEIGETYVDLKDLSVKNRDRRESNAKVQRAAGNGNSSKKRD